MTNELAIMPLADFRAACDAARAKTNAPSGTTYTADELNDALADLSIGTDTTSADASAGDIDEGFIAYAGNEKITGTKVLLQLSAPVIEALGETFRVNKNAENGNFADRIRIYSDGVFRFEVSATDTRTFYRSDLSGHDIGVQAKWCGNGFIDSPLSNTIWGGT